MSTCPSEEKSKTGVTAGAGLRLARQAGHVTLYDRRCERNECGVHEQIFDLTGGNIGFS